MSPADREQQLVDDLSTLPDAFERLNYLVSLAAKAEPLPAEERCPENLVEGCQAELWLAATRDGDRLHFRSYSPAPVVAAIAHLFETIFNESTPGEILTHEPNVIEGLGLHRALTPNRQNGARQIILKIKAHASLNT